MTVRKSLPPSRAGSVAQIAGDLALNFANTESGRGYPSHQDQLQAPDHVARWLAHAGALEAGDAARLAAGPRQATLLAAARRLRADVYAVGEALAARRAPPGRAIARIAALYARCLARGRLAPQGTRHGWRWSVAEAPLEAALGPIAHAATALLTERDPRRVKQCGGYACGWLFYDTSRNNSRRWCEMEICGNRAKQRRLAARSRAA